MKTWHTAPERLPTLELSDGALTLLVSQKKFFALEQLGQLEVTIYLLNKF